jgi:hypothetical protein
MVLHKTKNPLTKKTWRSHTRTRKHGQITNTVVWIYTLSRVLTVMYHIQYCWILGLLLYQTEHGTSKTGPVCMRRNSDMYRQKHVQWLTVQLSECVCMFSLQDRTTHFKHCAISVILNDNRHTKSRNTRILKTIWLLKGIKVYYN